MSAIGLDFGTGNSVLALMQGNQAQVFRTQTDSIGMSSDVLIDDRGLIYADPQDLPSPPPGFRRVAAIKRHLLMLPFGTGSEHEKWVTSAVARLRYLYESFLASRSEPIVKAVLTCPANASQVYRELLIGIGRRINLPEVDIVDEPTAAAVHHGLAEVASRYERWLVVDWGCGTCDVSLIERHKGQADLQVKAVKGDNKLGGMDMDGLLRAHLARRYSFTEQICPLWQVESVKKRLSEVDQVTETLNLEDGRSVPIAVIRPELETLIQPLLLRVQALITSALEEVHWGDVHQVIATGGPMLMPAVRRMLAETLDRDEDELLWRDPLTSVAQGAARLAELKRSGGLVVTNQVAQSIGVRVVQGTNEDAYHQVIHRGDTRPTTGLATLTTSVDLQDVIAVEIREGDNRSAAANALLGRFNIVVRPEKKGEVKVRLGVRLGDAGAMETWVEAIGDPNALRQVQKLASLRVERGSTMTGEAELRLGDPVDEFQTWVSEGTVDPDVARQHYERLKIKYHPDRDPDHRDHWNERLAALDSAFDDFMAEVQRRIRATTLPDLPWNDLQALRAVKVDEVLAQRLVHCLARGIGGEARQSDLLVLLKRYPDYRRVLASYLFAAQRNSVLQALLAQDDRPHVGLVVLLQNLPNKPIRERHEVLKAAYRLPVERVREILGDPNLDIAQLYVQVPQEAPQAVDPLGRTGATPAGGAVPRVPLTFDYRNGNTYVSGKTYQVKERLKELGCRWDRTNKEWYVIGKTLTEKDVWPDA